MWGVYVNKFLRVFQAIEWTNFNQKSSNNYCELSSKSIIISTKNVARLDLKTDYSG